MVSNQKKQQGFALLLTLLVVTVLISVGVSILSLSISQVRLASNARDSEVAFHAANAGMECALYWRREKAAQMESGADMRPIGCFGDSTPNNYSQSTITSGVSGGQVYRYRYEFEWGAPVRCTQIDTIVGVASLSGAGLQIPNMRSYLAGYPGSNTKVCEAGTRCSVISVQGYNKACGSVNDYGTVQREVLLQL